MISKRRLNDLVGSIELSGLALTAEVTQDGQLRPIRGASEKILAAARAAHLPSLHTVLVAAEQAGEVGSLNPELTSDVGVEGLRVISATTLTLAAEQLLVNRKTRWDQIPDYRLEMDRHPRLIGRDWLKEAVRAYVRDHERGYLLLTAGPGTGKTAFIVDAIRQAEESRIGPAIYHFFNREHGSWASTRTMLQSLIAQSRRIFGRDLLPTDTETKDEQAGALDRVFHSVLTRVSKRLSTSRLFVLIDGLDEASRSEEDSNAKVASIFPGLLPEGVLIVMTSRPGGLEWLATRESCTTLEIGRVTAENLADIEEYLEGENRRRDLGMDEKFILALVGATEGVFAIAVKYLQARPNLRQELAAWQEDGARIPRGIDGWLEYQWEQLVRTAGRIGVQSQVARAALGLLASAQEPLSLNQLVALLRTAEDEGSVKRIGFVTLGNLTRHLETVLGLAAQFFDPLDARLGVDAPRRFFHSRFADLILELLTDIERQDCHRLLFLACMSLDRLPPSARSYATEHRIAHLRALLGTGPEAVTEDVVSAVCILLKDENRWVRTSAAVAVGSFGDAASPEIMLNFAGLLFPQRRKDASVGRAALDSLRRLGVRSIETVTAIAFVVNLYENSGEGNDLRRLTDTIPSPADVVVHLSKALIWFASNPNPPLACLANRPAHMVRPDAAVSLAGCLAMGATELAEALVSADATIRIAALEVVLQLEDCVGSPRVVKALVNHWIDRPDEHPHADGIVRALGAIGPPAGIPEVLTQLALYLHKPVRNGRERRLRDEALETIAAIGEIAGTREILAALEEIVAAEPMEEWTHWDLEAPRVLVAVAGIGPRAATKSIVESIVRTLWANEETPYGLKVALGRLGESAATSDLLSWFVERLDRREPHACRDAAEILTLIGPEAGTKGVIQSLLNSYLWSCTTPPSYALQEAIEKAIMALARAENFLDGLRLLYERWNSDQDLRAKILSLMLEERPPALIFKGRPLHDHRPSTSVQLRSRSN